MRVSEYDALRIQKRVLQSLGVGIIGISRIADADTGTCTLILMVEQQVLLTPETSLQLQGIFFWLVYWGFFGGVAISLFNFVQVFLCIGLCM